jgi:hypothetical protein
MIERLHPGVYVVELPCQVHPIDGVQTSGTPAPDWTEHNAHDPGVSLLQLFSFLTEGLFYRADLPAASERRGIVSGLAVSAALPNDDGGLHLRPGLAMDASGQPVHTHLAPVASRYIGETEKHLAAAFAPAPRNDAVLCYDEADALFGKKP